MKATAFWQQWSILKAQNVWRYGLTRALGSVLPVYLVNEYPRSGGTWLSQMLSRAMGVHFQRLGFERPVPSVVHACYGAPYGLRKVCILWRDGRDSLVSLYHHLHFPDDVNNGVLVDTTRRRLQFEHPEQISENLPIFIEALFEKKLSQPRFSWKEFVRNWIDRPGVIYARYEDLKAQPVSELKRICAAFSREVSEESAARAVEELSFQRISGRIPGQENKHSFLRRGIVGDWKNHFTPEACQVFDHYAGDELVALGYERDRTWADSILEQNSRPPQTTSNSSN